MKPEHCRIERFLIFIFCVGLVLAALHGAKAWAFAGVTFALDETDANDAALPTWVVARNRGYPSRPVYALDGERVEVARAPVGAACGDLTRTDPRGRQWRAWLVDGAVVGEVYCEATGGGSVAETTPDDAVWVVSEDFFGDPNWYRSPVFSTRALAGAVSLSHAVVAQATVGDRCHDSTRRDQSGPNQWRLWRDANGRAIGEVWCRVVTETRPPVNPPGFQAVYFTDRDQTDVILTRTEPVVDYAWGEANPEGLDVADAFSACWQTVLIPAQSGDYTLFVTSDDGARLRLNNELVIDDWKAHSEQESAATVTMEAGRHYQLQLDYFDRGGMATAKLYYRAPGSDEITVLRPAEFGRDR